jgi:hypothetical protein
MNANTGKLHALGQSLWLDNITRRARRRDSALASSRLIEPLARLPTK